MFVPEFAPANYSNALNPGARNEWMIGETIETNTNSVVVDCGVQSGQRSAAAQTTDIDGAVINANDTGALGANWSRLQSYMQNSQWTGLVALTVYVAVTGTNAFFSSTRGATPPAITTTQNNFHSGQITNVAKKGRIRHCPRSGLPGYGNEFIEDGYIDSMRVLADWYEPEDRTGMDRIIPSEEGVIDDEAQ